MVFYQHIKASDRALEFHQCGAVSVNKCIYTLEGHSAVPPSQIENEAQQFPT